jgi:hypothetical protein
MSNWLNTPYSEECPCCGYWPCANPWLRDRRPTRVPDVDEAVDAALNEEVADAS